MVLGTAGVLGDTDNGYQWNFRYPLQNVGAPSSHGQECRLLTAQLRLSSETALSEVMLPPQGSQRRTQSNDWWDDWPSSLPYLRQLWRPPQLPRSCGIGCVLRGDSIPAQLCPLPSPTAITPFPRGLSQNLAPIKHLPANLCLRVCFLSNPT